MEYKAKDLDSRSELIEQFSHLRGQKLLIESNESSPNQYKLIQVGSFTIGLIDHSFGVPVQIEVLDDKSTLLLGHESELDCISLGAGSLVWKIRVDSVFFQFKKIREENLVIVIEEVGVMALDFYGNRIWSLTTDVITGFQITDSLVVIKTMDEEEIKISISTGTILK